MAKVSYTDPNAAELAGLYNVARIADRFTFSRAVKKRSFLSADKIAQITSRSYLRDISTLWKTLDSDEKAAWKAVDQRSRKNGWQMFVKDCSARFRSDIAGIAIPNSYHQDYIGNINIEEGAGRYQIKQSHPNTYYVQRRVSGCKSMYQSVEIKEDFYLPFELSLSFKSLLESDGSDPYCRFFALVISHYQGRDIETLLTIEIPLNSDWDRETVILSSVLGVARYYDLYFDLKDVKGNLYFDNIVALHNGQNWARDPYCDKIESTYSRTWRQIAQNWELVIDSPLAYHTSGYLDEL